MITIYHRSLAPLFVVCAHTSAKSEYRRNRVNRNSVPLASSTREMQFFSSSSAAAAEHFSAFPVEYSDSQYRLRYHNTLHVVLGCVLHVYEYLQLLGKEREDIRMRCVWDVSRYPTLAPPPTPATMPPSLNRKCSLSAGCASAYPHPSRTRMAVQRRRPSHDEHTAATVTVTTTVVFVRPTWTRDVVPSPSTTLPADIMSESMPTQTGQANSMTITGSVRSGIVGGVVVFVGLVIVVGVIWVIRSQAKRRRQALGLKPSRSSEYPS
ncbi:hypothetical protein L227DRAFT_101338 [Lentinus tigrinus ALCF2SS1-6]|uniref:Uncharacterized protein n=1 Tax=Lentinus tigrinus ALCF2SS1-6 TaxID=1328759 RepID=A0A5C2SAX0_9APHY|nr:hypothetical protein L227DRAFT_101338 [Lentinus tigrinus ALCF2SS1-6]